MTEKTELAGWRPLKINGFADLIGPVLKSTEKTEPRRYALQTDDRHANSLKLIHGGVMTTFLDQVIAIEAWNAVDRAPTLTVQMDTQFLGSAQVGDLLEATAVIEHRTRSMIFLRASITCDGAPVATASAIMKIAKKAV